MSHLLRHYLRHLQPGADNVHVRFRCGDAALALLLKAMQHENSFLESDRVHGPICSAGVVLDQFEDTSVAKSFEGVFLGLERYDRKRVDGLWLNRADVDEMTAKLLGWDFAARVANPCIGADRADLVLAGCAILEAIRQVWPSERLRVADRGLREGILTELMAADGAWRRGQRRSAP